MFQENKKIKMIPTTDHYVSTLSSPTHYMKYMSPLSVFKHRSFFPVLQYLNEDVRSVVLIEDTNAAMFVAVGEYYSSDYTPDRFGSSSVGCRRMLRVLIKACTNPDLLLPYPVVDSGGKVVCRMLGDAFKMWWGEEDAVATCVDGATHTP
jgi:hypothetical protein